jgi:hypothetical protein
MPNDFLFGIKQAGERIKLLTFDHGDPHRFSTVCHEPGWQPAVAGTLDALVIYGIFII